MAAVISRPVKFRRRNCYLLYLVRKFSVLLRGGFSLQTWWHRGSHGCWLRILGSLFFPWSVIDMDLALVHAGRERRKGISIVWLIWEKGTRPEIQKLFFPSWREGRRGISIGARRNGLSERGLCPRRLLMLSFGQNIAGKSGKAHKAFEFCCYFSLPGQIGRTWIESRRELQRLERRDHQDACQTDFCVARRDFDFLASLEPCSALKRAVSSRTYSCPIFCAK